MEAVKELGEVVNRAFDENTQVEAAINNEKSKNIEGEDEDAKAQRVTAAEETASKRSKESVQ